MSNNLHDFIPDLAGKVAIVTGGHTGLYVTSPNSIGYFLALLVTSFSFLQSLIVASAPASSLRNMALECILPVGQLRNSRMRSRIFFLSTRRQMCGF